MSTLLFSKVSVIFKDTLLFLINLSFSTFAVVTLAFHNYYISESEIVNKFNYIFYYIIIYILGSKYNLSVSSRQIYVYKHDKHQTF